MKKRLCLSLALLSVLCLCCSCSLFESLEQPIEETPYSYDLSEYIVLGKYRSLTVSKSEIAPTEKELKEQTEADFYALTHLTDRELQLGDTVCLNYTATFEGKEYDDDTENGFRITLGENALGIPGFDEGLVGAVPGDTIALDLTFPTDYEKTPEYAGKDVSFIVTVNYVYLELPELTDEMVSTFTTYETVEDYLEGIERALSHVKLVELLWQEILDDSKVLQYPEKEYEKYYTEYLDAHLSLAQGYGMTLEELVEEMGMTMDGFYQEADGVTKSYIKEDLIVCAIAENEGLTLSEEEYLAARSSYFQSTGSGYYVSEAQMEESITKQVLSQQFLSNKVLDFICEQATVTED